MTQSDNAEGGVWRAEHRTFTVRPRRTIPVAVPAHGSLLEILQYRRTALGALIADLAQHNDPLCVTGSGWSQSPLYADGSTLVETDRDEGLWAVPEDALQPAERAGSSNLVLVAGGTKIAALMQSLDSRGKSLRTAGSHNGQSVAGMLATGSHGSMLGETGFEGQIRGLLLSTGPDRAVWLADAARPMLLPEWVSQFAEIGDPAHFPHALLHLGGLGYVSAVLIEATDRFGLQAARRIAPIAPSAFDAIAAGDYAPLLAGWVDGREPAFIELTLDPRKGLTREVMQTVYVKAPAPPKAALLAEVGDDTLALMQAALTREPIHEKGINLINVPDLTFAEFKPSNGLEAPSTLTQLTRKWAPHRLMGIRVDTYNAAIGVAQADLPAALAAGVASAANYRPHFVYTLRFARRSPASLSILRAADNAIINVDGMTKKFVLGSDSDRGARAFTAELRQRGIGYAMHWGKDALSDAAKLMADNPAAVTGWKKARAALLPPDIAPVFTSPALEHWGLV